MQGDYRLSGYQISCQLEPAHAADVKAVLAIGMTSSRLHHGTKHIAVWRRSNSAGETSCPFSLEAILDGHHAYINSLALIPADDYSDEGESPHQLR